MIKAIGIALTGLNSATQRLNASASNIANALTSGSIDGNGQAPYSAITTKSKALGTNAGVRTDVVSKNPPFVPAYDSNSPFADENGIIGVPNVDIAEEIVNLKISATIYKANIATIKAAESLNDELMSLFDKKV